MSNLIEMTPQTVHITVYARRFKLLAIASTDHAANEYMKANPHAAVIATSISNAVYICDKRDKGEPC